MRRDIDKNFILFFFTIDNNAEGGLDEFIGYGPGKDSLRLR